MRTYYRLQQPGDDPERLLDPDEQYSEPWGESHQIREGVSVFPDVDALYRYMIRRDADLEEGTQVVALEGTQSEDRDFDAEEGAMLVRPTRILRCEPLDRDRLEKARAEVTDSVSRPGRSPG